MCLQYICVRASFLSTYSSCVIGVCIKSSRAAMGWGRLWFQSHRPSAGWSVGSLLCVCVSVGPVCVHRAGGDRDGERGQPELAGWVMNLLLRHSLKHNYTHQSQEGLSRPLTPSCNKGRAKTPPLNSLFILPYRSNHCKPQYHF